MWKPFFIIPLLVAVTLGFGSDDRFLKKYALIKIFESCFGQDVVRDIRKELKAACVKCAALNTPLTKPSITKNENSQKLSDKNDAQNVIFANQQTYPTERLHQAILAFRPNQYPQPSFRPYPGSAASYFQAFANPGPMIFGGNYPPFPAMYTNMPYSYGYNPYMEGARVSRNVGFKNQLEMLSSKMSNNKISNVTCVMQELGYLDDNLEPNYEKIVERIGKLPMAKELKQDIQDGVTYCQQFSQCIPETKNPASPLTRELSKPVLFFKCYKYKKLEACVMKDVREKISNVADDEFDGGEALRRNGKDRKLDDEESDMSAILYDFLYGVDGELDLSNLL